jgi:hypothetical protein
MSGWKPRTPGPIINAVGVDALRITRDLIASMSMPW